MKNEFEMIFNSETIIELCNEDISSIPMQHLHFTPINQIQNMEMNSFIGL